MFYFQSFFLIFYLSIMQVHPLLKPYHWENRILIVFSLSQESSKYQQQIKIFKKDEPAIEERELVVFKIFENDGEAPGNKQLSQQEVESLRDHFKITEDYKMLLVGKDGSVKEAYSKTVAMEEINAVIDAMPMRQQEMQRKP